MVAKTLFILFLLYMCGQHKRNFTQFIRIYTLNKTKDNKQQQTKLACDGGNAIIRFVLSREINWFLSAAVHSIYISSVVQQQLSEQKFIINCRGV